MDKKKVLEEIFNNDPLGILNVKPKSSSGRNADDRLLSSFQEINDFINQHGRAPEPSAGNVSETQLYYRLKSLREDEEKVAMLKEHDEHSILPDTIEVHEPKGEYAKPEKKEINSIDDIFKDDSLDILGDDSEGLFEFKHTPKELDRAEADFIAKRKTCKDFDQYEEKFKQVHKDLTEGKRRLIPFKQESLKPGNFYVHNGVLLFLVSVNYEERKWSRGENEDHRIRKYEDGRTKTIFENGTESKMLLRSLGKALTMNGRSVTENIEKVNERFHQRFNNITEEDKEAGFIYVLNSKSSDERIKSIKNLFKIGYSKVSVEDRIKNAEKEPTYLMASVKVMGIWQCYNMNPQKFEQLIHNFFGASCLEIDVFDNNGKRHTPREWFIAPLEVIEQAIELIVSGQIIGYKYDQVNSKIVHK